MIMNKSGQGRIDYFFIFLFVVISFCGAAYKFNNVAEEKLHSYTFQIVNNLRNVDYDCLDTVVPQGKHLTKDGKAYYEITLEKEIKHEDGERTRPAIVEVSMKYSTKSIKEIIMLSSNKNDYKDAEMFENITDIKNNEKSFEKNLLKE